MKKLVLKFQILDIKRKLSMFLIDTYKKPRIKCSSFLKCYQHL